MRIRFLNDFAYYKFRLFLNNSQKCSCNLLIPGNQIINLPVMEDDYIWNTTEQVWTTYVAGEYIKIITVCSIIIKIWTQVVKILTSKRSMQYNANDHYHCPIYALAFVSTAFCSS